MFFYIHSLAHSHVQSICPSNTIQAAPQMIKKNKIATPGAQCLQMVWAKV